MSKTDLFQSPAEIMRRAAFEFLLYCEQEDIYELLEGLKNCDSQRIELLEKAINQIKF